MLVVFPQPGSGVRETLTDSTLVELFCDPVLQAQIRSKLPYLFRIAELESSRDGIIGMEVGSQRERILIA